MIHERRYRTAGILVAASGFLHLVAAVIGGFAAEFRMLLPFVVVYGLLSLGLLRNKRWVAYLAFLITLAGVVAAISGSFNVSVADSWVYFAIVILNCCAAAVIFSLLWNKPLAAA